MFLEICRMNCAVWTVVLCHRRVLCAIHLWRQLACSHTFRSARKFIFARKNCFLKCVVWIIDCRAVWVVLLVQRRVLRAIHFWRQLSCSLTIRAARKFIFANKRFLKYVARIIDYRAVWTVLLVHRRVLCAIHLWQLLACSLTIRAAGKLIVANKCFLKSIARIIDCCAVWLFCDAVRVMFTNCNINWRACSS